MNFDLTPEQRMIQESVRVFMEEEVAPFASEADATREFPMEYVAKMAKMGLLGMPVPKEYSGGGTDMISYILALEEIARTWAALAVIV
ncbi:MAG: acyl-CoA dehydrogenase family protein, partial [Thermoplasmata archaeon]|nr:acyl-CoA dehydrogenase family protein [Thermoplasmata archaeon]